MGFKVLLVFLYIADVVATLIVTHKEKWNYYKITKPLLMPLSLALYLVFLPHEALVAPYQKFAILALVFDTLGDIGLLQPKDKTQVYFFAGMASFIIGHIFYAIWFLQPVWGRTTTGLALSCVVTLLCEIPAVIQIIKNAKENVAALIAYSVGLTVLAVIIGSTKGAVISFIGILFFFLSDYTIARREIGLKSTGEFGTIATYILAQALILAGMYSMQV